VRLEILAPQEIVALRAILGQLAPKGRKARLDPPGRRVIQVIPALAACRVLQGHRALLGRRALKARRESREIADRSAPVGLQGRKA
jgi:hypothetical protein